MEKKYWFLLVNDIVKGPYTTKKVESLLTKNGIAETDHIWWKGQTSWINVKEWKRNLEQIMSSIDSPNDQLAWYISLNNKHQGPYYFSEVLDLLKQPETLYMCRLWASGMKDWKKPFEIEEVSKNLGLQARKHHRAPIKGELILQKNGVQFALNAASISEGGIGFKDQNGLNSGDIVTVHLKSPMLLSTVSSRAKIVYTSQNGITGLRFLNLQSETHSNIISYVKQFQTSARMF